jgi:hypothetical protein
LQEFPPTHFTDPAEVPLDEDVAPSCAIDAVARKSVATAEASNAPLVDLFMVLSISAARNYSFEPAIGRAAEGQLRTELTADNRYLHCESESYTSALRKKWRSGERNLWSRNEYFR